MNGYNGLGPRLAVCHNSRTLEAARLARKISLERRGQAALLQKEQARARLVSSALGGKYLPRSSFSQARLACSLTLKVPEQSPISG